MAVNDIVMGAAGASGPATYIEDVFSTWLYTGNGSTQTITNGIDLSGKGGLVWLKDRSNARNHNLYDTARGATYAIQSNLTDAQSVRTDGLTGFSSTGFNLGNFAQENNLNETYASWTFRKQPKFFDIVTYTGDGSTQSISHNLGSAPGCVIIKNTSNSANWRVWHTSQLAKYCNLNETIAFQTEPGTIFGNNSVAVAPTSTSITVGSNQSVNANGQTYVAYLFAHDAGGFGLTGTDNVISCGSFTSPSSGPATVNIGYEPQWLLVKPSSGVGNWFIVDNMRGWTVEGTTGDQMLFPNLSNAEATYNSFGLNATGFSVDLFTSTTYIYIAIRRPMKTPTTGTEVFSPNFVGNTNANFYGYLGSPLDLTIAGYKISNANNARFYDRLRGGGNNINYLVSSQLNAEASFAGAGVIGELGFDNMFGAKWGPVTPNTNIITWNFKRAAGFFDVVCYTGTGNPLTLNHNLTVAPELILYKSRSSAEYWFAQCSALSSVTDGYLLPNYDSAAGSISGLWRTPTSTTFGIALSGNLTGANTSGVTYVSYLFATVAGVSKVFSFTGNGSSQTINCSFTTGARFILIKRTDSTGDWYVWDSARGIVSGNDPHLSLNTTAAEVTTDDTIDPDSTGFIVNQVAATNVNVNAATYIGIAIA